MALGSPNKAAWTLHGASGAFAGAEDEVYAVLSNSGLGARVFSSQASASKPSPLRKLDVGAGGAAALFAGPSWPALPKCALPFIHALMDLPFAGVLLPGIGLQALSAAQAGCGCPVVLQRYLLGCPGLSSTSACCPAHMR